jgi:hypothetical protein
MAQQTQLSLFAEVSVAEVVYPRWATDGRPLHCVTCAAVLPVERLHYQAGRTRFCAQCALLRQRERAHSNGERYAQDGRYKKSYLAFHSALSASSIGAVSEMLVCVDLSREGFEVFRAVSPAATCDLLALKDGRTYRIEVKTARRNRRCRWQYDRKRLNPDRYDVLVLVEPDGLIHYRPSLLEAARTAAPLMRLYETPASA